jgi:3-deoxy-D-manno-octulosonic-acid transferase
MRMEVNARGLSASEIQSIIDQHIEFEKRWKERGPADFERERKEYIKEIALLSADLGETDFCTELIERLKKSRPDLFEKT